MVVVVVVAVLTALLTALLPEMGQGFPERVTALGLWAVSDQLVVGFVVGFAVGFVSHFYHHSASRQSIAGLRWLDGRWKGINP